LVVKGKPMEKIVLEAKSREEVGKDSRKLHYQGQVVGVVYGRGQKSTPVKLERKQLEHVYWQAGTNKIVSLKLDGRQKNALFHDVQRDPRTGTILHVDLYTVRMDEKIKTEVPLHFVGESTAVYQQEGTLVKNLETVEVEALPADLPESIEVDISVLDDFEKTIHVSDLAIPADVELLTDTEELVVKVEAPRSDDELAELEEAPVEALPEGVEEETTVVEEESGGNKDQ
jgi:large subunit ribosomal protein L25